MEFLELGLKFRGAHRNPQVHRDFEGIVMVTPRWAFVKMRYGLDPKHTWDHKGVRSPFKIISACFED